MFQDYAYTTFSGWLIASSQDAFVSPPPNSQDRSTCCCSRVCPVQPNTPFLRPSYNAPRPRPPATGYGVPKPRPPAPGYGAPNPRPTYDQIPSRTPKITSYNPRPDYNPKPSYKPIPSYKPDLIPPPPPISPPAPPVGPPIIVGKETGQQAKINDCCDSLLVSASSRGRAISLQVLATYSMMLYNNFIGVKYNPICYHKEMYVELIIFKLMLIYILRVKNLACIGESTLTGIKIIGTCLNIATATTICFTLQMQVGLDG